MNAGATTLGLLAGGRATRLAGLDKAWMEKDGTPQVLRLARRVQGGEPVRISHRDPGRTPALDGALAAANPPWPTGGLEARATPAPAGLLTRRSMVSINDACGAPAGPLATSWPVTGGSPGGWGDHGATRSCRRC